MPPDEPTLDELMAALGVAVPVRHAVGAIVRGPATEVQRSALEPSLGGGDLLAVAPTGSGKSLVFAVALVHRLAGAPSLPGRPRALVLAPTRELADQNSEVIASLGAGAGMKVDCFVGGASAGRDRRTAVPPLDVVVGTPGRILDLIRSGILDTADVDTVVLDEADHLVSASFAEQTGAILDRCPGSSILAVTATADRECVAILLSRRPGLQVIRTTGPAPAAAEGRPPGPTGPPTALVLVVSDDPVADAAQLSDRCRRALFFVGRRDLVAPLRQAVAARGVRVTGVDGTASPTRRAKAFSELAQGAVNVLVTTDLSGRGLDLEDLGHVVHVGLPHSADDLVHRSGRTGRGSRTAGVVLAVVYPHEEERLREQAAAGHFAVVEADPRDADSQIGPVVTGAPRRPRRTAPADDSRRPGVSRRHRPKRRRL